MLEGGDEGDLIIPGKPDESLLIISIRHEDEDLEMPSKAPKLEGQVIKDFEEWVMMGAPDPRLKKPTAEELEKAIPWLVLLKKRSKWWSFQPLKERDAPDVSNPVWNKNPIDQYLFASLKEKGLKPVGEASPEVLVRRIYLILTGLPPKSEVVEAFVADPSQVAYEKLVDGLLTSKGYAERWARYWMDWYRYAESHGSEGDPSLPYISEYRSYLIRAFEQDVPYDQLIREHLAGDLLENPRINKKLGIVESAIGPAHVRMAPHGFGVADAYGEQVSFVDNQVDVISKAMLAMTVSCARCHNHKFDPISHKDFYSFYGIMVSNRLATINVDTPEKQAINKKAIAELKGEIKTAMGAYWKDRVGAAVSRLVNAKFQDNPQTMKILRAKAVAKANKRKRELEAQIPPPTTKEVQRAKKEIQKAKRRTITLPESYVEIVALSVEVKEYDAFQSHPFSWAKALRNLPKDEFAKKIKAMTASHKSWVNQLDEMKKSATFYLDLRDQDTLDKWYMQGNGLSPKVSPAGSFALAAQGGSAITGIYPAGVYSHLFSGKHSATMSSIYHIAEGKRAFVKAVGDQGRIRMSVRNYPLTHGGLHPEIVLGTQAMKWHEFKKYKFWNEEKVHFDFFNRRDVTRIFGSNKNSMRSHFGISEIIAGVEDDRIANSGAPLNAVSTETEEIEDRASLITVYENALMESIKAWEGNSMTDSQAEFLSAFVRHDFLPNRYGRFPDAINSLFEKYRKLEAGIPEPTRAPGIIEGDVVDHPLLGRGNYNDEKEPVDRKFLDVFSDKLYSKEDSGRLEFAEDMVSPMNTLKSRVLVNRLWNYVFGRGIVSSTDNFGRMGKKPTHPELLDYLALDFEKKGWSMRKAIRQMVLSRAFRASSNASDELMEADPENLCLSHYTPRRLDAEAIMDSINFVGGGGQQRAIYTKMKRNSLDPFLKTFNLPIGTTTRSNRDITNVPAQALTLLNGELAKKVAKEWSENVIKDKTLEKAEDRINSLFMDAYARKLRDSERKGILGFYNSFENSSDALNKVAFAILNSKEFIYVH